MTNKPEPNTRAGEALKPCPWGCAVKTIKTRAAAINQDWHEYQHDRRKDCPVSSKVLWSGQVGSKAEAEFFAAWNTRRLPQPSELVEWLLALAIDCDETDGWEDAASDVRHAAIHISQLEAQLAKLQADGDKLAGALRDYHFAEEIDDEAVRQSELAVARQAATQALTEWKDRA